MMNGRNTSLSHLCFLISFLFKFNFSVQSEIIKLFTYLCHYFGVITPSMVWRMIYCSSRLFSWVSTRILFMSTCLFFDSTFTSWAAVLGVVSRWIQIPHLWQSFWTKPTLIDFEKGKNLVSCFSGKLVTSCAK